MMNSGSSQSFIVLKEWNFKKIFSFLLLLWYALKKI
jgi:hypothetical protein